MAWDIPDIRKPRFNTTVVQSVQMDFNNHFSSYCSEPTPQRTVASKAEKINSRKAVCKYLYILTLLEQYFTGFPIFQILECEKTNLRLIALMWCLKIRSMDIYNNLTINADQLGLQKKNYTQYESHQVMIWSFT